MAEQKKSAPAKTTAPAEPVNSEQLDALAAQAPPLAAPAAGVDLGELEERTVEAETRAQAAELRNEELQSELVKLQAQVQALMRAQAARPAARDTGPLDALQALDEEGIPLFDETLPHGLVYGDTVVAYIQNGCQFGRDRKFVAREANRGTPRAFNPRLVGVTRPRPGMITAPDPLAGIRDQTWDA